MIDDLDDLDDDDGALPPHLRALLDGGGGDGPAMSKGAEARVMSRVLMSVGAVTVIGATAATAATTTTTSAATATATTAAATTTATTFLGAGVAKVAMGVAVFVGVATTAVVVQRRPPPAPAPATTTVATTTTTTPVPPAVPVVASAPPSAVAIPAEPSPIARVRTTATTTTTTTKPTSAETPSPLPTTAPPIDEVVRLEAARAALSAGRAGEALSIIDALTAAVSHSAMGEERDALRVLSLVAVGRVDDASVEAAAFFERHPRSLFAPRIRAAVMRGH